MAEPSELEMRNIMRSYLACLEDQKECKRQVNAIKQSDQFIRCCDALKGCTEERKALEQVIVDYMIVHDISKAEVMSNDNTQHSITPKKYTSHERISRKQLLEALEMLANSGVITTVEQKEAIADGVLSGHTIEKHSLIVREMGSRGDMRKGG